MYKYILTMVIIVTKLTASYAVGDTITIDDQLMKFPYCYPSDSSVVIDSSTGDTLKVASTFRLAHNTGKVFLLEMSASW